MPAVWLAHHQVFGSDGDSSVGKAVSCSKLMGIFMELKLNTSVRRRSRLLKEFLNVVIVLRKMWV